MRFITTFVLLVLVPAAKAADADTQFWIEVDQPMMIDSFPSWQFILRDEDHLSVFYNDARINDANNLLQRGYVPEALAKRMREAIVAVINVKPILTDKLKTECRTSESFQVEVGFSRGHQSIQRGYTDLCSLKELDPRLFGVIHELNERLRDGKISIEPDAAPEPPPAVADLESPEAVKTETKSDAPADGGGR